MDKENVSKKLDQLLNGLAQFNVELATLKEDPKSKKTTIADLESRFQTFSDGVISCLNELKDRIIKMEDEIDENQQYSRRNCLILHGLGEGNPENHTQVVQEFFKDKLKIEVTVDQIDRAHRLGVSGRHTMANAVARGARPMIVKFVSYRTRQKIFQEKKVLKGTKITITESLTARRTQLMKCAKERFGLKNVWTMDGKIVIMHKKKKHYITNHTQLTDLENSTEKSDLQEVLN